MRFLLMVLMVVASPLWADEATEKSIADARAMIYAHDIEGFSRAIIAAHAADLAANGDQNLQRTLFTPFGVTDPRVAAFTADWLAAEPDSPYALTARVWYLRSMGWAMRGTALPRFTWPAAMDQMAEMHGAAMKMALRAHDLAPDLVAASDAVIRMGQTFGMTDLAEDELARIMAIAPNHGSLMRAVDSLSPRWGGSVDAVARACEDYATLLPDVDGYTVDICLVEMFIQAQVDGPARDWAWDMLTRLPDHPNLIFARMKKAVAEVGPLDERITALEAYLADGGTYPNAALYLDFARSDQGVTLDPTYPGVNALAFARDAADLVHDGGNPDLVRAYFERLEHLPVDQRPDIPTQLAVLRKMLEIAPYNARGWADLADVQSLFGTIDDIRAAAPAVANAVAYSNHHFTIIAQVIAPYRDAYAMFTVGADAAALNNTAFIYPPEFDAVVACPYMRLVRVMDYVCKAEGKEGDACRTPRVSLPDMLVHLDEVAARGACGAERTGDIESLAFWPADAP